MRGKQSHRDTGWWILVVGFTLIGAANFFFAPAESGIGSAAQAELPTLPSNCMDEPW